MAVDHFKIDKGISLNPRAAAPASPVDGDLYYDSVLQSFQFRENGQWIPLGSGGGTGGINYLQRNSISWDFEFNNTTGWSRYANLIASSLPDVNPTGTPSVNVTLATTAVSPLRQTYSAVISKDSANRQANGVRTTAFNIDNQDVGQPLFISFDYKMSSNYVSDDMRVYISDGVNIIPPSAISIPSGNGTMKVSFTATSSTSYRLYFHIASTSALPYTMTFDNVSVGPQVQLVSAAIGDWQSYVAPITSTGTAPTKGGTIAVDQAFWRRVGDTMEIAYNYRQTSAGTAGTGQYLFGLPSGYTIDSTKVLVNTDRRLCGIVGHAYAFVGNENHGSVFASTTTALGVAYHGSTSNPQNISSIQGGNFDLSNSDVTYTFFAKVPIVGWSTNIQFAANHSEYGFNTGNITSAGATDSTSFGYGAVGTPILAYNSTTVASSTNFRVNFKTPIQPTDVLILEIQESSTSPWEPVNYKAPYSYGNSAAYGARIDSVPGSSTDILVSFNNGGKTAANNASYGGTNGDPWSGVAGTWRWRVRKSSGIAFGEVTAVPNIQTAFVFNGPLTMSDATDTLVSGGSFDIQPGTYWIEYGTSFRIDNTTGPTKISGLVSVVSALGVDFSPALNQARATVTNPPNGDSTFTSACGAGTLTVGTVTNIKLQGRITVTGGSGIFRSMNGCFLKATKLY